MPQSGVRSLSTSFSRSLARQYPGLVFLVQLDDFPPLPAAETETSRLDAEDVLNVPFIPGDSHADDDAGVMAAAQVTFGSRAVGAKQTVTDAAVYILHLPSSSSPDAVYAELMAHLPVLRARKSTMLIWTGRLLHNVGSTPDPEGETAARSRDLLLLQLAGQSEMELSDVLGMIDNARDSLGGLVVTSRLRSRHQVDVAVMVKYQGH